MFRFVLLAGLVSGAGCASDDTCGEVTLQLGEDPASYPTSAGIACDIQKGGWWDKSKNEAAIVLSSADLPTDVYLLAVMPSAMVKTGMTFSVPTGIAGEAYTSSGASTRKNHAFLTGGTIVVEQDRGTDDTVVARVFKVKWDLSWLGTGEYRSTGESSVWFKRVGPAY